MFKGQLTIDRTFSLIINIGNWYYYVIAILLILVSPSSSPHINSWGYEIGPRCQLVCVSIWLSTNCFPIRGRAAQTEGFFFQKSYSPYEKWQFGARVRKLNFSLSENVLTSNQMPFNPGKVTFSKEHLSQGSGWKNEHFRDGKRSKQANKKCQMVWIVKKISSRNTKPHTPKKHFYLDASLIIYIKKYLDLENSLLGCEVIL